MVKYRTLQTDDIIQIGDEYDACVDGWRDPVKWEVVDENHPRLGGHPSDPLCPAHTIYRRKIDTL